MKSKASAILIVAILALSTGVSTIIPSTFAHNTPTDQSTWTITTFAYAAATPNPVGVGQQVLVFGWLSNLIAGVDLTNNIRFHGYQFTITKPDGSNDTKNFPIVNDATS